MNTDVDFWLGIAVNTIWIACGGLCILGVLDIVPEDLTWWLFGIALVCGGALGLVSLLRAARR